MKTILLAVLSFCVLGISALPSPVRFLGPPIKNDGTNNGGNYGGGFGGPSGGGTCCPTCMCAEPITGDQEGQISLVRTGVIVSPEGTNFSQARAFPTVDGTYGITLTAQTNRVKIYNPLFLYRQIVIFNNETVGQTESAFMKVAFYSTGSILDIDQFTIEADHSLSVNQSWIYKIRPLYYGGYMTLNLNTTASTLTGPIYDCDSKFVSNWQIPDAMPLQGFVGQGLLPNVGSNDPNKITCMILPTTYSLPNAKYYVVFGNNFAKTAGVNEPLYEIKTYLWNFTTESVEVDVEYVSKPALSLMRLSHEGSTLFKNLTYSEKKRFFDGIQNSLAEILPVDPSRIVPTYKSQADQTIRTYSFYNLGCCPSKIYDNLRLKFGLGLCISLKVKKFLYMTGLSSDNYTKYSDELMDFKKH
ncbi:6731_t:CDS:2, partial [Ambispora leptoticha]